MKATHILERAGMVAGLFLLAISSSMAYIQVEVDGNPLSFNVPPTQINGRTMVPLRGIFEALGAQVNWDANTRTITANKGDTDVELSIGDRNATVSGRTVRLDTPAMILRGSTMVPLRFVSEALGADVKWFSATQTVSITTGAASTVEAPIPNQGDDGRDRGQSSNYSDETGWKVSGIVSSVDYGGHEIKMKTDQSLTYTIYAANAAIYEGNMRRDINSLRRGDQITVFGRESGDNYVEARSIRKIADDSGSGYYDSGSRDTRASGKISSINIRNNQIAITGDRNYSIVTVDIDTKIYARSGKRLDLEQLRRGDQIRVTGSQVRGNSIHAASIYVSVGGNTYNPTEPSYNDGQDTGQTSIRITAVIDDVDSASGRIGIQGTQDYTTVIVNSRTRIYASDGRITSLRNLQGDDSIRVVGYASRNNEITATEIRQQRRAPISR